MLLTLLSRSSAAKRKFDVSYFTTRFSFLVPREEVTAIHEAIASKTLVFLFQRN